MLTPSDTALLVVDVQGKLAQLMHEKEDFFGNLKKMIRGARILAVPILWMEQIPEKLGRTTPEIAELLTGLTPMPKVSFSACGDDAILKQLNALNRRHVLVSGIETHICVYQTAADLVTRGYDAQVVVDAVASRFPINKEVGLEKIRYIGATLTTVETALFEMMKKAEGPQFKEITKIIK